MNKISKLLYISIIGAFLCPLMTSCGVTTKVIEEHREVITYKDSTIYHQKDSIVLIPVEKIIDIVPSYDTLKLETSLSKSVSYVDTLTHTLKGSIENKKEAQFKYKTIEVERLVEVRDTVQTIKSVPVEVKVPVRDKLFYYLLIYFIGSLIAVGIYIYSKLKL